MAASDNIPIEFFNVCGNSFYFEIINAFLTKTDLQTDAFRSSSNGSKQCWIQSMDRKYLVLKTSEDFDFQDRNSEERQQSDCTFKIQIYQDTSKNETQPVMLYTKKSENQAMVVCCQNTREVIPKTMDVHIFIPERKINDTGHKALFYWKKISSNMYTFESTVYKGHFLAFEPIEDPSCLMKLTLRSSDEVDDSTKIFVTFQT
ncbi:interleukin-18-like [Nematolebias whitei]|uniref:interleukin-18-like n=1 Tax=Nematolebias whitei TaxID=451745 RepID=UPI00189BDB94|nr:interleukin-18-like [Nematolebias whitei]